MRGDLIKGCKTKLEFYAPTGSYEGVELEERLELYEEFCSTSFDPRNWTIEKDDEKLSVTRIHPS